MTNQVNQAFEKLWYGTIANLILCSRDSAEVGYQAATQASESEINSLKERVAELESELFVLQELRKNQATLCLELTASNNQLREAFRKIRSCYGDGYEVDNIARQALSSTPAQSLAEHDNDVIERIATALENAEGEFKYLPDYVALVRALKVTP